MAKHSAVGIAFVKAPGGGLVLVEGTIELSKAKSLSPAWTRELLATRPKEVVLPPDPENGRRKSIVAAVLTKVGTTRVHGESAGRVARRANTELARLLDEAFAGKPLPLEALEELQQPEPKKEHVEPETANRDKFMHGEREAGFVGLPDSVVRKKLLDMGRRKSDVDRYLAQRKELAA